MVTSTPRVQAQTLPAVAQHAREGSDSAYRATDADVAIIDALTAAGRAAGWVVKVLWMSKPDAAYDSVEVQIGPQQPMPTERSAVSWNTWTRQVTVRPGWLLRVGQVAEYIAAYIERRSRGHMGYDGLEAVYHTVTGRTGRNPYTAADVAEAAPAQPSKAPSKVAQMLAAKFAAETVCAQPSRYVEPTDANLADVFAPLVAKDKLGAGLLAAVREAFLNQYAEQITRARAVAERCGHQTGELGCELRTCWGVPPQATVFSGWRTVGEEEQPGEPGVYSVGRAIVAAVRRLLPEHTVTNPMYGETPWGRDKTVRQASAFRFVVGEREVTVVAYESRSALVADTCSYLAVWVDGDLVAGDIRQNGDPAVYARQVALAVEPKILHAGTGTPQIRAVVRVLYAHRGPKGERVDITDEAGARALVDRFGHAIGVRAGGDGMSLLVAMPAYAGPTGARAMHAYLAEAGLLPVIVDMAEWEAAAPIRVPGRWGALIAASRS
jgi:hypothetical protein